ncbi:hypothetical protein CR513_43764, partial [Mucuna pruriens]
MKRSIPEAFRDFISKSQSESRFLEEIEQFFAKNEKAKTSNLLAKLISRKYKGKENIREYIMEVSNLAAKLKSLKLELDEDLIVHLVLISLPTHFRQFKVSYNTQKDKWSLNELISHYVQEEERLQRDKTESVYFVSTSQNKKRKNITERSSKGKVSTKAVNKTPYELWIGKKSNIKHLHIWGCPAEAWPYKPHERKLDSRIVSCYFVDYAKHSQRYKFYDPTSRSFLKMGNARILEEVEFGKEENMRNVVFEEEFVNDIEITPVIRDNVQTIFLDIVPKQDYDKVLPQTPIKKPQQPQKVSLRKSIRERRHAIPDVYIVFLQQHEDDIGLTEDDPINFCQAIQSPNSQNGLMP